MEQESEPEKAAENPSDTPPTGNSPEASSKALSTSTNAPTRKKFPPDHPYHFAWDTTEENLAKGVKHLIFVGGQFSRKKTSSTSEPTPPKDQNS